MTLDDKIKQRFQELEMSLSSLKWKQSSHGGSYLANDSSSQWLTSVSSLFEQVFGRESTHYEQLHKCWNDFHGYDYEFDKALGVFRAAKEDYVGGYLFRLTVLAPESGGWHPVREALRRPVPQRKSIEKQPQQSSPAYTYSPVAKKPISL